MQSYQFEQISADPDKPLADGIRPLDTADMERYGDKTGGSRLKIYTVFFPVAAQSKKTKKIPFSLTQFTMNKLNTNVVLFVFIFQAKRCADD